MFQSIWLTIAGQIRAIETVLYAAMAQAGAVAITTGIVMLIFWVYAAWKIYEMWIVEADGSFTRKLWFLFTNYRRLMIVYLLVIAAPVLCGSLGGVARGFARQGRAKIEAAIPDIFGQLDVILKQASSVVSVAGVMLEAHGAGRDANSAGFLRSVFSSETATAAAAGATTGLVGGHYVPVVGHTVGAAVGAATGGVVGAVTAKQRISDDKRAAYQDSTSRVEDKAAQTRRSMRKLSEAQAEMAERNGDKKGAQAIREAGERAAKQSYKAAGASSAMMDAAVDGSDPVKIRAAQEKAIWTRIKAEWENAYKRSTLGGGSEKPNADAERWATYENSGKTPEAMQNLMNIMQTLVNDEMRAHDAARSWQDDVPSIGFKIIGILGGLICVAGVLAAGLNIFKAAYGAVLYCVGYIATVIFAVSIAMPLSSAFMLCFISDKTESYGRNFVNFMLSGVFGSMGMMLMAGVCGKLFQLTAQGILSQGDLRLHMVLQSTWSIGEFLLACVTMAGAMMIAGMAFTFIADFLKKGAAIGSGLFSGSFPH